MSDQLWLTKAQLKRIEPFSTAEELLPCQAVAKWQSPRTGNWGCKSAPNRAPIHNRSMPWMLLGNTGTAAEHEAKRAAVP